MKVELNNFEIQQWAKQCRTMIINRIAKPFDTSNGGHWSTAGETQALDDLINLIDLHGQDFAKHWQAVYDGRVLIRNPEYHKSTDKCNGDAWWITGYEAVVNKFGITLERKAAKEVA